jgi:acetyltransferase-like isoleucine patch superfamily enzyme
MKTHIVWGYQKLRILKFRILSDCKHVYGTPIVRQPVQYTGLGVIRMNGQVNLGVYPSPFFLSGCIYLEARSQDSLIEIEDGVWINNNTCILSDGAGVYIGKRTMLGTNCEILDSDFHDIHPDHRMTGIPRSARVVIEENVLIGSNVKILKGVRIGKNSVVANGSVVTKSIPESMLAFGNPIKCGPLPPMDKWTGGEGATTG